MGYKLTVNKINCEISVTDREGYKIDYNNYNENEFDITITCDLRRYESEKSCTGAVMYHVGHRIFGMRKESRR